MGLTYFTSYKCKLHKIKYIIFQILLLSSLLLFKNCDTLKDPEVVKQLANILKTNVILFVMATKMEINKLFSFSLYIYIILLYNIMRFNITKKLSECLK